MSQIPVPSGCLAKLLNGTISASLTDAPEQTRLLIPEQPQLDGIGKNSALNRR